VFERYGRQLDIFLLTYSQRCNKSRAVAEKESMSEWVSSFLTAH